MSNTQGTEERFLSVESVSDLSKNMTKGNMPYGNTRETVEVDTAKVTFPIPSIDIFTSDVLVGTLTPSAVRTVQFVQKVLGNLSDVAKLEIGVADEDKNIMFASGLVIPADIALNRRTEAVRQLNAKLPKGEKIEIPEENEAAYFSAEKLNAIMKTIRISTTSKSNERGR